eukprot:SAG11_NODE_835_length_6927_cov_2.877142_8_plen_63_part_00
MLFAANRQRVYLPVHNVYFILFDAGAAVSGISIGSNMYIGCVFLIGAYLSEFELLFLIRLLH